MYSKLEIKKDAIVVETGDAEFHPSTANINGRCYFRDLPDHLKPKQLLYKTEDNWFVYDYDTYPIYKVDERLQLLQFAACDCLGNSSNAKYFKNKDAANDYILMNKPILSIKDVEDYLNTVKTYSPTNSYIKELKRIVVERELTRLKAGSADR